MFKKVAFTMYPVQDWKRARAFYGETLGLKIGSKSADGVWTEYDLPGGGCLALEVDDLNNLDSEGNSIILHELNK